MEVKIHKNTTSEDIRKALSGFGRFSSFEINEEKNEATNEKCLIFREIGFFEGLHRLIFEKKEKLEESRKRSREFLYNFSKERPEVQKLLGIAILDKEYWTVGEFREKLKIKTVLIKYENNNKLLETPLVSESKVGVIDANISKVKADSVISWKTPNVDSSQNGIVNDVKSEIENSQKTISVTHEANPDDAQIRAAYQSALSKVAGQVVISPIVDVPIDQIKTKQPDYAMDSGVKEVCSDDSIRILLTEIDKAVRDNKNITSVTIARGGGPDERFLSRVVAQRAILDETKRQDLENKRTNLPPMPDSLKLFKSEMEGRLVLMKGDALENPIFHETGLERVKTCNANPEMLAADVAFLDVSSIARGGVKLKKSGLGELARIWDHCFNKRFVTQREVDDVLKTTKAKWNIGAFELPACELPANQVIAMENVIMPETGCDKEMDFFMTHLINLKGKVVIEIGDRSSMRNGLVAALKALSERPGGLGFDCVLAYGYSQVRQNLPGLLREP
jgi:hypothetical protein